jgi:hypothetical protein
MGSTIAIIDNHVYMGNMIAKVLQKEEPLCFCWHGGSSFAGKNTFQPL